MKQSDSVALREISALRALLSLLEASRGDEITRDSLSEDERRQEYEAIAGQLADLANQTGTWQRQLAKEKAARKRHKVAPDPGWSWSDIAQERLEAAKLRFSFLSTCPDDQLRWAEALVIMPRSTLRFVVTTILNAFPPLLEWDSIGMIQHSGTDLIFGIRPLIYSMIREDLLAQVEIRLCRNKSCGRFFRADRRDQTCCKAACSERVRYLKYYETKRKPARLASRKLPG